MNSAPSDFARRALDAAPEAMIIIDGSGVVRFAERMPSPRLQVRTCVRGDKETIGVRYERSRF